ncbi:DUF1127 domain-containing protein [Pseudomonas xanthosomatis]|uniref:DUF1127 domain-containing protein n=1 Tax=Pseudomonas fakonensis TaxID=2842355 RepID=A0ABX8NAE1_9PSED|nr:MULTISPECIES: DUF1127 domain-containing protein [Pseudomonas]QXH48379.1 DUF1127 domain-containing protein [Pseudomonas xanthosomatis]QXH52964.1 DUF1127 domain-containing protein [Pseudomonas fakonensis]
MKGHASFTQSPVLSHLLRWYELYQQRQELARMSDATLHDLGLSRADIQQEAERHFWDDPLSKG